MIEIFKTNIQDETMKNVIREALQKALPNAKIAFDLDDYDKVLRIEDATIDPVKIVSIVTDAGADCKLIPDKICPYSPGIPKDIELFWNAAFEKNGTMWGFIPSVSAVIAKDFFLLQGIRDILMPGIGYGRNASIFISSGISVTGIEISKTAIEISNKYFKPPLNIFHGSVTEMPFNQVIYEGIFCYGLLYLLNDTQRKNVLTNCYAQLKPGGWMMFSVISKNSPNYGVGKEIGKNTFEIDNGVQLFFYDLSTVKEEFGKCGVIDVVEIEEPNNHAPTAPAFKFFLVKCYKPIKG